MKAAVACAALCLVATGCGSASQTPPVLQGYQSLEPILRATTAGTARLASDSLSLRRALNSLQADRVRREAGLLGGDARRLEDDAGLSAARIRPLLSRAADGHIRTYFGLILASLTADWAEAQALGRVAAILAGDPWLVAPSDARSFNRLEGVARGEARSAGRAAATAGALRRRYPRSFQYIPVRPAHGTEAATSPHGSDG
jgi:hypothetical protein